MNLQPLFTAAFVIAIGVSMLAAWAGMVLRFKEGPEGRRRYLITLGVFFAAIGFAMATGLLGRWMGYLP